jgi:hypothetical protein
MHIYFENLDPRWAIVLAGAVSVASKGTFKKLNPPFSVSFSREDPLVAHIADSFDPPSSNMTLFKLPEEQYPFIDYFQAATAAKSLLDNHGIKQEPNVVPIYLSPLASNSLLLAYGIASTPDFFCPVFSKAQLESVPSPDGIIELESMRGIATAFLTGLGVTDPEILCLDGHNSIQIALLCSKTRAIFARPYHLSHYILRSKYNGYDRLSENIPAVAIIDETCQQDNRYLVNWNGQIPVFRDEPVEAVAYKGKVWMTKAKYGFNHREFLKDHAKGLI